MTEKTESSQMHDDILRKAMQDMGWDLNSHIPMANKANAKIFADIETMFSEKTELEAAQNELFKRVEKLQQHYKNATICINHNLKLLNAYNSDVNVELNRLKIAEREHSKLIEDHKNVDKDIEKLQIFVKTTEKEVCKRKQSIDKLTNRIKWAKTALVEWNEATEDSNKGTQLIEKYFKEDLLKAKQQDQRRRALLSEIERHRKILVKLYEDQKCLEQNLECTAKIYRSAHLERRQMVETWKSAVQQMVQRERCIQKGDQDLALLNLVLQKKRAQQSNMNAQLNEIINNNREVESAIEELNIDTSGIKEQIQMLMDMILLKENETELLQKELQNLSNRVQQQRADNRKSAKEKQEKIQELERLSEVILKLEERLGAITNQSLSAQQRLNILEGMNDAEDKAQYRITKEVNRVNDFIYRVQLQLQKFKSEEKILLVSNDGMRMNTFAILKNAGNIEKELKRKIELHYQLGFKCLDIERQIIKAKGGAMDPEIEQRNLETLAQLEEDYTMVTKRLHATEAQNKKLDDNMRNLTHSYNSDNKELEKMSFLVKEAQVYCEGGMKRLRAQNQEAQVLIVELSILKMRANDFEKEISKSTTNFYNLEKHRAALNRTIKDRVVEIKSQMDLLALKRKHLNEERSTLRADIGERDNQIKAVRARFELTAKLLGTNEDGTMVTATQLRVRAAQEKQLLLEEGDQLNQQVLKAEQEVEALENTLMIMNNSNDSFKKNFKASDDKDEALNELKTLQKNYCKGLANLKTLRNKLLKVDSEMEKACERKQELLRQLDEECEKREQIKESLCKLQKEIDAQKMKLQRADREVKVAIRNVKEHSISDEFLMLYNRDLDLREIEHKNMSVLNQLVDLAEGDESVGPKIIKMILHRGLKLPQQLARSRSMGSWRSEASELSVSSSQGFGRTSRSTISEESQYRMDTSSAVVSIVSIDFNPSSN